MRFTVPALGRHAACHSRLGAPVVPATQRRYARRPGNTLRRIAAASRTAGRYWKRWNGSATTLTS
ncbi:hypothetical protein AB0903_27720 [Streptomyces sp. NPDC048389]|uniref:hypothetical protein n=1 Tax=Streptomyces sp. NPDC048389 TaxID=3154622 RepID=UPI0034551922